MLVLGRKRQESVVIGATGGTQELAHITVLEIRGRTVKLGFQADEAVAVYREEVWQRICVEKRAASPTAVAKQPKYRVPYLD